MGQFSATDDPKLALRLAEFHFEKARALQPEKITGAQALLEEAEFQGLCGAIIGPKLTRKALSTLWYVFNRPNNFSDPLSFLFFFKKKWVNS